MAGSKAEQPSVFTRAAGSVLGLAARFLHWADGSARQGWGSEYLRGPYAPAEEEAFERELEVAEGAVPPGLRGAFVRNGELAPLGGHHWFDGDGMLHCVTFHGGGRASYCSHWVQTARLAQEERLGLPLAVKIGDCRGRMGLAYMGLDWLAQRLGDGVGRGNTAVAFHAGRLLALHETDLPYTLRLACSGLLQDLGRATLGGKAQHPFTAHPKLDPQTGELFYIGYDVQEEPYCWYGWLDARGQVVRDFAVPLPEPVLMHDFAITEQYALLLDVPLAFDPMEMVRSSSNLPFVLRQRPLRIGVLPRYAHSADGIRWFETESAHCFHVVNAWEEGPTIHLFLCPAKQFSLSSFHASDDSWPHVCEVVIDMAAGTCSPLRRLCPLPCEFPTVPASRLGRPTRFAYISTFVVNDSGMPVFDGIAKVDLLAPGVNSGLAGHIRHGGGRRGGEAFFVPRPAAAAGDGGSPHPEQAAGEDDGYLMTFVVEEGSGASELVLYDAAKMSSTPVVRLRVPRRVPLGFHCRWVSAEELATQAGDSVEWAASN